MRRYIAIFKILDPYLTDVKFIKIMFAKRVRRSYNIFRVEFHGKLKSTEVK